MNMLLSVLATILSTIVLYDDARSSKIGKTFLVNSLIKAIKVLKGTHLKVSDAFMCSE